MDLADQPDGRVYPELDEWTLTGDATIHVVGKFDPVGWPTFVGRDVYLSGSEQLRRVRNIARNY